MSAILTGGDPIGRLYHVLDRLRTDGDRDVGNGQVISVAAAMTFLAVAQRPGLSVVQLAAVMGQPVQSVSRNLIDLSRESRAGRVAQGLDLITSAMDPADGRRKLYHLTAKGKDMAASIKTLMEI